MVALEELKDEPGIYCIENLITHKKYVGQASSILGRFSEHIGDLNHQRHFNEHLQNSWNKYGEDNFTYSILEYCTIKQLDERESYYIDTMDLLDRDLGYNMKRGGQHGGGTFSKEVKEKLSKSIKKSFENPVRRKIQSERAKEFWSRQDYRDGHSGVNAPMYGRHHTDEVKEFISKLNKGQSRNMVYKDKVICIETGCVYDNSRIAQKEINIDSSCILKVCRGERKIAGGYHWEFVKEENLEMENKVS